jgi:hypothetical protein
MGSKAAQHQDGLIGCKPSVMRWLRLSVTKTISEPIHLNTDDGGCTFIRNVSAHKAIRCHNQEDHSLKKDINFES